MRTTINKCIVVGLMTLGIALGLLYGWPALAAPSELLRRAPVARMDTTLVTATLPAAGSPWPRAVNTTTVPVSGVTISGPTTGVIDVLYPFTATVNPVTATTPITYVWHVGQAVSLSHVSGITDTTALSWTTSGSHVITVTATHIAGSVSATHAVTVVSPTTHWVITNADAGAGSLRQALLDAEVYDTIRFDTTVFPPTSPTTITVLSGLPVLTQGYVTVDASDAGVIVDGQSLTYYSHGLHLVSDGNIIKGLQIVNFSGHGVAITDGATYNVIGGDWTVGSAPQGEGNVLTRNSAGVSIEGTGTMSNTVSGNLIGVDVDGALDFRVQTLAFSPAYTDDHQAFLGTRFGGVWKTTDGGVTWTEVNHGITISDVRAIAVSPDYAGDGVLFAGTRDGGIFKATDRGASWTRVDGGLTTGDVVALEISPDYANDGHIYAATDGGGVLASDDGGTTWSFFNEGEISTGLNGLAISSNYVVDRMPTTAGALFAFNWDDVFKWVQGQPGESAWTVLDTGVLTDGITALALSPAYAADQTVFVGTGTCENGRQLWKSDDGGEHWTSVSAGGPLGLNSCDIRALALSPNYATDQTVFVGDTWSGVYKSGDGGLSWTRVLTGHYNRALALSPAYGADQTVFVGQTGWQLLKSVDGGNTWTVIGGDLIELGNRAAGVSIVGGARSNRIGGDTPGVRNVIGHNYAQGVLIADAGTQYNVVSGNYIGTDAGGSQPLGNAKEGVSIVGGAQDNRIGGTTAGERNIISGNAGDGVYLADSGTMSNTVVGNYIGVDVSGSIALGNADSGVDIVNGAQYNRVGGLNPGARNVIAGNDWAGVSLANADTAHNVIRGNFVGVAASGTTGLGNRWGIGCWDPARQNSIMGNVVGDNKEGVHFNGCTDNHVTHNFIGTDASGTLDLGNLFYGVHLFSGARDHQIGPGNHIAYNDGVGVDISGAASLYNTLTRNSIHDNGYSAIALYDGGNAETPAPSLVYASSHLVTGTTTVPSATIELFSGGQRWAEARTYEATTVADASGIFTFAGLTGFQGIFLTATGTDPQGNTSELSDALSASPPVALELRAPSVGLTSTLYPLVARVGYTTALPLTYTWHATGQAPVTHANRETLADTTTFAWPTLGAQAITVTVTNPFGIATATHTLTIGDAGSAPAVAFEESGVTLPGAVAGTAEWGDYDADGDLDILLTGYDEDGQPLAVVYRNDTPTTAGNPFCHSERSEESTAPTSTPLCHSERSEESITTAGTPTTAGAFTQVTVDALAPIGSSDAAWGDYDNDGDLDLLLSGNWWDGETSHYTTALYRNNGTPTTIGTPLCHSERSEESIVTAGAPLCHSERSEESPAPTSTPLCHSERSEESIATAGAFSRVATDTLPSLSGAVAWGDYDNDGDLDLALSGYGAETGYITAIYRNDVSGQARTFTVAVTATFAALNSSAVAWGDYDNDSDLDLLLTGWDADRVPHALVYRNEGGGTFAEAVTDTLPGLYYGDAAWGDYDQDGDLDILVSGARGRDVSPQDPLVAVYRNDGAGAFTAAITDTLTDVYASAVAWGDYDNDGDLDIVLNGHDGNQQVTALYRNGGAAADWTFTEVPLDTVLDTTSGAIAWGDYDNDGDLDLLLAGYVGGLPVTRLYDNITSVPNTPPAAPDGLRATVVSHTATLTWHPATDAETPASGLSYNLRVGTAPGRADVVPPMALISGTRQVPALGNAQQGLTATLTNLTDTLYYWSVQAVDAAWAGSPFAEEQRLVVGDVPLPLDGVVISGTTQGVTGTLYTFTAGVTPTNAATPITYTWTPAPQSGQGQASARYRWSTPGVHTLTVVAENVAGLNGAVRSRVTATHIITVTAPEPACPTPLQAVGIRGATQGYTDTLYTFTAVVTPANATLPITTTWRPAPETGQGTANAVYRWTAPGVHTITVTAEHCGGAYADQAAHAITLAAARPSGDAYEDDDVCAQAPTLTPDGTLQQHTFHDVGDVDWVAFPTIAGATYLIEATTPATSTADVSLEVYAACGTVPTTTQDHTFSPDVRLRFKAVEDGTLYIRLGNHFPEIAGTDARYELTIRELGASRPGAVIIVAGRYEIGDPLQRNIHNVTNAVYNLFLAHGYGKDRLYYLATDRSLDADGNGFDDDVDLLTSHDGLKSAITQWALDKVGPDRALTLYLMDHGGNDRFYLNGTSQTVNPEELDQWLDSLEAQVSGVRVNVIMEACHSGSFVDSLAQEGRVVIASTAAHAVAYATDNSAVFSEAFLAALDRGLSLYGSFEEAQWMAEAGHPDQTPWLDDNGDGLPNREADGLEAARRGFAYVGTFPDEQWPPYILWARVNEIQQGQGVIEAEVRDDQDVNFVWAVVYKPSYTPPDPEETEELPQETLPALYLSDSDGDGIYSVLYEGFNEIGAYRVVLYAADNEDLQARPKVVTPRTGWPVYLPMVLRQ